MQTSRLSRTPPPPAPETVAARAERAARFQPILDALARHERTEAWLARQWGVSRQSVNRYKAGLASPELPKVIQACATLGIAVPPSYLTAPMRQAQHQRIAARTAHEPARRSGRPRGRPRRSPVQARDGPPDSTSVSRSHPSHRSQRPRRRGAVVHDAATHEHDSRDP